MCPRSVFQWTSNILPVTVLPRRAGGDLCRPAISAVPTAFVQEDSDNIVVKAGVPCAQMFPPFQIGCAAGVCLTGLWSVRGWTLVCYSPKQDGSAITELRVQRDTVKSLCGSRTDANKASQNCMTTLRTIVPQRLEDMMATCNPLDIAGWGGWQNILHRCLLQSACSCTCQRSTIKGCKIATPFLCYATGHLSFEMSCSFKYQDEMCTWCQGFFIR